MSLNFDTCKEVVELVWGWDDEIIQDRIDSEFWQRRSDFHPSPKVFIENKVNSWEGFGRTVEAMEARLWGFNKTRNFVEYTRSIDDETESYCRGVDEGEMTCKSMIEATHLAALEAIKQEDEKWNS